MYGVNYIPRKKDLLQSWKLTKRIDYIFTNIEKAKPVKMKIVGKNYNKLRRFEKLAPLGGVSNFRNKMYPSDHFFPLGNHNIFSHFFLSLFGKGSFFGLKT